MGNIRKNEKFVLSKPEKDQSTKETDVLEPEIKDETVSDNIPELEESESEERKELLQKAAESLSSKHGKILRRLHHFHDDIERLIEIQAEQRRLRNRRLYDSNEAVQIMEPYQVAKKKRSKTKYTIKRF